jgi:3-keto-L-gulonate-6-phosphate decarboxylase
MDIIKPAIKVSHFNKDNVIVNTIGTFDFYNRIDQVKTFNDYALMVHHNVQSLNNKLLDIAMMLS